MMYGMGQQSEREILPLFFAGLVLAWIAYLFLYPWFVSQTAQLVRLEIMLLTWVSHLPILNGFGSTENWFGFESVLANLTGVHPITDTLHSSSAITPVNPNLLITQVYALKELTHKYLVWIAIAVNGLFVSVIYRRSRNQFVGALTLAQLDIFISRFYYPSRPVVGRHYQDRHPIKDSAARFALKPWEFACRNHLLRIENEPFLGRYADAEITLLKPTAQQLTSLKFSFKAARLVFKRQLGSAFGGTDSVLEMPSEYRAILVVLLVERNAKLARRHAAPDHWLKQYASSFWSLPSLLNKRPLHELPKLEREVLNLSGVDQVLQDALKEDELCQLLTCSSYIHSMFVHLMTESRVSTAKLVWLKPINRTFFYVLNNTGRPRRLFVEGHAAHAHAQAEQAAGRRLSVPQIHESTKALHDELVRHRWLQDDGDDVIREG